MKLLTFVAIFATLTLSSCQKIEAQGDITTKSVMLSSGVDDISVRSEMRLTLSEDVPAGEIRVITNENIHEYLKFSIDGDEIDIELKSGHNYKNLDIVIMANAQQFNSISASGSSKVQVYGEGLAYSDYDIDLSGSSSMSFHESISTKKASIELSGSSSLYGDMLSADDLFIDLSGSSKLVVKANISIAGTTSGSSKMEHKGSAHVGVISTGTSSVRKIE